MVGAGGVDGVPVDVIEDGVLSASSGEGAFEHVQAEKVVKSGELAGGGAKPDSAAFGFPDDLFFSPEFLGESNKFFKFDFLFAVERKCGIADCALHDSPGLLVAANCFAGAGDAVVKDGGF